MNLIDDLNKKDENQKKQQYRNALDVFKPIKMESPNKHLEQIALKTKSKKEEHMLVVMDKSTLEEL